MADIHRPEGQSVEWNRGVDWAIDVGDYHDRDSDTAANLWGYELGTPEYDDFMRGVDYAQLDEDYAHVVRENNFYIPKTRIVE